VGVGGVMSVLVEVETWVIGKGGTKGGNGWGRGMEAAGFCGPCVCLGVFMLL
jgi:hypothetical protein